MRQSDSGTEPAGSRVRASEGPGGRSSPGAVLSEADRRVYDLVRPTPEVWDRWCRARRATHDPASEYCGWPLHVTLVLVTFDEATAELRAAIEGYRQAVAKLSDACARRDRRERVYRAIAATPGRPWNVATAAMAEYVEAQDRAIGAGVLVQRATRELWRASWWWEAWVRSGELEAAMVHMRVARRALEHGATGADEWYADPPPELPPPPPAPAPPAPKATPKRRGPFAVLRQTTGAWIVVDRRRPLGDQEVYKTHALDEANFELAHRADAEAIPEDVP